MSDHDHDWKLVDLIYLPKDNVDKHESIWACFCGAYQIKKAIRIEEAE